MHENIRGAAQTRNKHFHANLTKYFQPINLPSSSSSFFFFLPSFHSDRKLSNNERNWDANLKFNGEEEEEEEEFRRGKGKIRTKCGSRATSRADCFESPLLSKRIRNRPTPTRFIRCLELLRLLPVASMNICRFRFRTKSSFPPPNYNAFPHRVCIINSSSRCFPRRSGGRIKIYFEWGKVLGVGGGAIRFRSYRFDLIVFFSIGDGILIIERNDGISAYSKR